MAVGEIGLKRRGLSAGGLDLPAQPGGAFGGGVVVDGQRHAPVGQGLGHDPTEPPSCAGHQGHLAPELHQRAPVPAGDIGRISPVWEELSLASAITPSVRACISTYWAEASPTAATLSTVLTMAGAIAFTRMPRSRNSS